MVATRVLVEIIQCLELTVLRPLFIVVKPLMSINRKLVHIFNDLIDFQGLLGVTLFVIFVVILGHIFLLIISSTILFLIIPSLTFEVFDRLHCFLNTIWICSVHYSLSLLSFMHLSHKVVLHSHVL